MALSSSPRKLQIPLATGDETRHDTATSFGVTKRAFFCGVVIEGAENGRRLPDDVQDLVMSLGVALESTTDAGFLNSSRSSDSTDGPYQRKRAMTDTSALSADIRELVTTERNYVERLRTLKNSYADPLRSFSRDKNTSLLPAYEAKVLFGNVDSLIPVNEAFLTDLEKMMAPNGAKTVGGVGDVALRHFKELRGFELYKQYYSKREEAQAIFEREVSKKSSQFVQFVERIKYEAADATRNRVGLRELLIDPVQRIPRYTLLFRNMIKHMAPEDPQREKLIEADEIASKIAQAEADEQTKRAAVFYCLSSSIEGFPADLHSISRRYIDCIDVEDIVTDGPLSASASTTSLGMSLNCTLFLFDDKMVIAKRPHDKSGKALSGLDSVDKVTKGASLPAKRRSGMSCKGVVDIADVVATDIGGADINMYFESPPRDQSERWSGRPFRALSVVHPPHPVNLDPTRTQSDKQRFLENLWLVQAKYRARAGQSVVLCSEAKEVEARGGRSVVARAYYNVYQRTAFLQEAKKTKAVVHVDASGCADNIPFGVGNPPFVCIRLQPIAGELCRVRVTSSSDDGDGDEDEVVQSSRVPSRIVQTIHQYGLFDFRSGRNSIPSTPTAKSKASLFNLDVLSRKLNSDFFAGSVNGHRRAKSSTTSRGSVATHSTGHTQSTSTGDSFAFSNRSTSTAATSVDDNSMRTGKSSSRSRHQSSSRSRKLVRGKSSPLKTTEDGQAMRSSSRQSSLASRSRSTSRGPDTDYSDMEEDRTQVLDSSEWDLHMKLELARKNSQTQHGKPLPALDDIDMDIDETILEEEPPQPVRPLSRASRDNRSILSKPESELTVTDLPTLRPSSRLSDRPRGPRSPSPLPPSRSPEPRTRTPEPRMRTPDPPVLPSMDEEMALESTSRPSRTLSRQSQLPPMGLTRSVRKPFYPTGNTDATPRPASLVAQLTGPIEPLSIKKKASTSSNSVSSSSVSSSPVRRSRYSPPRHTRADDLPRVLSPTPFANGFGKSSRARLKDSSPDVGRLIRLAECTREDVDSARRVVKRIKLEVDHMRINGETTPNSRPGSPDKSLRTPQRAPPLTRDAQERMEEMRKLLGQRDGTPRSQLRSVALRGTQSMDAGGPGRPTIDTSVVGRSLESMVSELDDTLARAATDSDAMQDDLEQFQSVYQQQTEALEKSQMDVQNAKRQAEVVKSLLADATAEKEIMYQAFNDELDGMFNDANLPDDEAWSAMTKDLRDTKKARNNLTKENSGLKRRLAEMEMQQEEWASLLRAHGLIP
ncbi:hypothetical protein BD626DRAFT_394072 [Schizophyllum amplum]|uniref:DH domain-containing protein n=1 Tax=Schizophyllum amplum TaxID=97359 RepID=A0A550CS75_9AGAR|nr:hypothetical protein BD626DRAFT_394072 [Auriculariopsis ampla]